MQSKSKPKILSTLLKSKGNSVLGDVLNKVQLHLELEVLVKKYLPKQLSKQICVANYRDNCLVLGIKQSSFAMELHYHTDDLLKALKKDLPDLLGLEIKVLV